MAALNDRRILVMTTNFGTESDELTKPIAALREAGATVTVAASTATAARRAGRVVGEWGNVISGNSAFNRNEQICLSF